MRTVIPAGQDRTETTSIFYPPRLRLLARRGSWAGQVVRVSGEGLTIGREGTLALCTNGVSRHHATLNYADGIFSLVDLKSRNGTFLNGERIVESAIHPGDLIEIAEHCFEVELGAPEDDALPAAKGAPRTAAVGDVTSAFRVLPRAAVVAATPAVVATVQAPPAPPKAVSVKPPLAAAPGGVSLHGKRTRTLVLAGCVAVAGAGLALRSELARRRAPAAESNPPLADPPSGKPAVSPQIAAPQAAVPEAATPHVDVPQVAAVEPESAPLVATPLPPAAVPDPSPDHHHHHHRHGTHSSRTGADLASQIDTDDVDALREMHRDIDMRFNQARRELRDALNDGADQAELASCRRDVNDLGRRDRTLRALIDELVAKQQKTKRTRSTPR